MSAPPSSFFVGRSTELQQIADTLMTPVSAGVVLVGPSGIGKTALLQKALTEAQPEALIVRLRGSAAMVDSPYSALNGLLSELDDEQVSHPVTILRALSDLLGIRAEGRLVILAVDNVELLDLHSAMIVAQLVAGGVAKALLTTRHFNLADSAFMALWRKGSLLRLDVEPFSLKESSLFTERELGAPVSGEVVRTAHRLSCGYPKLLRGCLREVQRQGLLVQGSTSWVMKEGIARPCREAAAATMAHIDSLGGACRTVSVLVALSGGLPLSVLLRLTDGTAVDSLQAAGLLTVGRDQKTTVRSASVLVADGVRMQVGMVEAQAAYELAASTATDWDISALPPHHHAAWRQKAGLTLDAGIVARAARRLNDNGMHSEAIELCDGADGTVRADADVEVEMLRARLAQGDYAGAARVVSLIGDDVMRSPEAAVRLLLMQAELSQRSGTGSRPDILDKAEAVALVLSNSDTHAGVALRDEVLVARAEMLSFEGCYRQTAELLTPRRQSPAPMTNDTLVRIDTLLCEAWSMGVQQLDALELARTIAGFILENRVSARTRELAYAQVWEVHRTAGDVDGARHIRELTLLRSDEMCFAPRSYEQVARALAHAYQGRDAEALEILLPTFDQLRLSDPWGALPAAAAGISYCYAKQHDIRPMIEYVQFSEPTASTPWKIRQTARYFQLLASSHTENRVAAGQDFQRLALLDSERQGTHSMRMLALFRAARLGNQAALEPLSSIAAQIQGPFARLGELYAKGIGSQDYEFLIRSMEMASAMGDLKLAREAAQHALQVALKTDDKRALRHVQRQVREVMPESENWGTAGARLAGLTRREREIALAAVSGASNRDIANDLCVSVRTVEGHLYQVYSKLNVCSRAELIDLIPAAQAQP
ncbi:LuxR C-terminal-related transcriptional regulator [Arthrobacter sp. MDT3-44]